MIKIAFCDDDVCILNQISSLLNQYRTERNREIEYRAYQSPLELLEQIERGNRFDILILDVLMPGENGMEAASEIRNYDSNVKIIFLTSSAEYAVESYTVGAYYYLLKPVRTESFFCLLDSAASACEEEKKSGLLLRCKNGITRIVPGRIEYCEVIHRTLFIHMTSGKTLESIGSLDELSRQLEPYGCFLRAHRSYLVNLEYVQNLSYRAITMSCLTEIPIPRGKYNEIKNAFLNYAFQGGQVTI